MRKRHLAWLVGVIGILGFSPTRATATQLQPYLSGLSSPLFLTHAGDGTNRVFVVEQGGRIKVVQPGPTTPTVFLDISSRVLAGGERGLLGLAFHPQYASNGRFFVDYTRTPDGATVIAEYHVSGDPNVADPTETVLLTIAQPFANHNGGMVAFGSDGELYIGMGDGGSGNDPGSRGQDIDTLLGKILRIDVSVPGVYTSPPTNPFSGATPGADEIFAVGMRNPFRFSFDRNTGALWVGDVGQNAWEEVDVVTLGGNYGWRVFEGNHCTGLDPALCSGGGYTGPVVEYFHAGGRCSVTGGYVYRGSSGALPGGTYIYGDYCTGEIFTLNNVVLFDTTLNISSFGEDQAGELYVVNLGGSIQKLVPDPTSPTPTFTSTAIVSPSPTVPSPTPTITPTRTLVPTPIPTATLPASVRDGDGDGFVDLFDNCPNDFNPAQSDGNHNGSGDVCDSGTPASLTLSRVDLKTAPKGTLSIRGKLDPTEWGTLGEALAGGLTVGVTGVGLPAPEVLLFPGQRCVALSASHVTCVGTNGEAAGFTKQRKASVFNVKISGKNRTFPAPLQGGAVQVVLSMGGLDRRDSAGSCKVRATGKSATCKK